MKHKFFESTIESKFIKNLLLNTSLPIFNSVRDGDYVVKGFKYLYDTKVIYCTKSGYLGRNSSNETTDENIPEVGIIENNFILGRTYTGRTEYFQSNSNSYDSLTHKFLGRYLRFYRDIYKTDLMPFYNCFNGVYTSKFYIDNDSGSIKQNRYDYYQQGNPQFNNQYYEKEEYKIVQVPIKFNTDYTIAIDCNANVFVAPCFIRNNQLVYVTYGGKELDLSNENISKNNSIIKLVDMKFKTPNLINISNINQSLLSDTYPEMVLNSEQASMQLDQLFQTYEKDLYLLIQLPKDNSSSIVVLEGNYTNLSRGYIYKYYNTKTKSMNSRYMNTEKIFDFSSVYNMSDKELNEFLISGLSLLNMNDSIRYPYSDRLIEYLLWNVTDNNEEIGGNVTRIQRRLGLI